MDVGHDEEIGTAFAEYDRLVRWEEHDSRLGATDPVHERAAARGRIVALVASLALATLGDESPAVCVCGHLDLDHGDDQEVDADGRPTSPRYILCFKCLEVDDSPGVYSHDFEPRHEEGEEA